jgi:hypothetical protein
MGVSKIEDEQHYKNHAAPSREFVQLHLVNLLAESTAAAKPLAHASGE